MIRTTAAYDIEIIAWDKAKPFIPEKQKGERSEPWDKLRFDSNFNMVCCWSMFDGVDTRSSILSEHANEHDILSDFWDSVMDYQQLVGFNSLTFDAPFLIKRSWYNGVKPPRQLNLKRYINPDRNTNHVDLRCLLSNWDSYAKGSLDLYCQLMLGTGKGEIDGSMVQAMWDEGKFAELRKYNEEDARLTYRLWESMIGYFI
jgi:predicted PolB exonuclease-like 3'-5' exonuclease